MAKLVDALASGASARKGLGVRIPLSALWIEAISCYNIYRFRIDRFIQRIHLTIEYADVVKLVYTQS